MARLRIAALLILVARPAAAQPEPAPTADTDDSETIEVTGSAPIEPGDTRIDADRARTVAGTSGDALKVVQSLPGVARAAPGSGDLVVWGAAPEDTRVFVDGVPVPALYHLGGWRAVLGSALVGDITLRPAGFGADHGDALGGVVDVATTVPRTDGASLALDLLDGSGSAHYHRGATTIAGAGRASWLDRLVEATAGSDLVGELAPVPRWADAQLLIDHDRGDGDRLRVLAFGAGDQLDRELASDDPAATRRERARRGFARLALEWRRDLAAGHAEATGWIGVDRDERTLGIGGVDARLARTSLLGGLRALHSDRLGAHLQLDLGVDVTAARTRLERDGSLSIPAREGDLAIFGQPPGDDVAADRWSALTVDAAPFATLAYRRGRIAVVPGLRLDGWALGASRLTPRVGEVPGLGWQRLRVVPEPRLAVHLRADDRTVLSARLGVHHQARDVGDTSAVFGTPSLELEGALHATAGVAITVAPPMVVELVGFVRRLDDLVARSPAATPMLAGALTQDGTGDVLGTQLTARLAPWHQLDGWASYVLARSQRRDTVDGAARPFDHDLRHDLLIVLGWQHGAWSLGGRFRVTSGPPRTAVIGAFFDAATGSYQPITGVPNGIRLPATVQLDARIERRLGRGIAVTLELLNVTDHDNPEELAYSADWSRRDYITGLPLLVVIGARLDL